MTKAIDREQIEQLLTEGISHREIARTTGISRDRIAREFPGTGWTYKQAGAFGLTVRRANEALRKALRR